MADPGYLTPAQIAAELHVTVVTVRRWINTGALRASKAGPRKWMIARADLAAFLAREDSLAPSVPPSEDPSFQLYLVMPSER